MADSLEMLVGGMSPASRRLLATALSHCYELVVRGMAYRCRACGREGTAVAVVHVDLPGASMIYRSEVVGAEGGMTLAFAKELLDEARHPLAATVKLRRREDDGEWYLSSGCAACDAMYDPYELADMVDDVQDRGEVGTLPVLARGSRTIAEWATLFELAQTSGFDDV